MKLNRLYIENFGGLHQYALDFESDLTVIRKENGFGKSTLAEFIRAMFYGFPRKGKTLDKSRRQKYTPWNGGTFGGNLEFEADGNRYRVEGIASHSESLEPMVVYRALYGEGGLWVRPAGMWNEWVSRPEYEGPRFIFESLT